MDAITNKLVGERTDLVTRAEGVKQNAFDDGQRDLNDTERSTLQQFQVRVSQIDEQLRLTTQNFQLDQDTAAAIARYSPAALMPEKGWQYRSAGELLWDVLNAPRDRDAQARYQSVLTASKRAAEHMGTEAAATTPVAGGFGGIIVDAVTGPVISLAWTGMPLVNALSPVASPSLRFRRPRIVDASLYTAAGPHAGGLQKGELPSKHFEVVSDEVSLTVLGNYLNVSLEAEEWIPQSLDIVVRQLNNRLAVAVEKRAVDQLAATTAKVPLAADADSGAFIAAIYDASALVFTNTGAPASWIAMGPAGWARAGSLVDAAKRPLLPTLGAANAIGTASADALSVSIAGLRTIITPGITDTTMYVGNAVGAEVYYRALPMLQAVEPSVLGRQVAVAAGVGFYTPPTTEAGPAGTPAAKYEAVVEISP